jgi:hypothetical protein
MKLNFEILDKITEKEFVNNKAFPYIYIKNTLHEDSYEDLIKTMPNIDNFEKAINITRNYGQQSHDRWGYGGWTDRNLKISDPWKKLIKELKSSKYKKFLSRLFRTDNLAIRFMWHYATKGQSISPHYDSPRKLGSHIFYFNDDDWNPAWGGQTVLCFDKKNKILKESAPSLEDFDEKFSAENSKNCSLIFRNSEKSWHSVSSLNCPEGKFRKVFIVVIENESKFEKIKRIFTGYPKRGVV